MEDLVEPGLPGCSKRKPLGHESKVMISSVEMHAAYADGDGGGAATPAGQAIVKGAGGFGMSLMMALEIESGVSLDDIVCSLIRMGVAVERGEGVCDGYLTESGGGFRFKLNPRPEPLVAEGEHMEWDVGMVATFHLRAANLMEGLQEIYEFMHRFSDEYGHRFVLSFQFEAIYAVRSEAGLDLRQKLPGELK